MSRTIESLPARFPIFPLPGAVLLPGGNLPLNIFEPRYLQMVRDAVKTDGVIGMIQPMAGYDGEDVAGDAPLFRTGCAGRITHFEEMEDGRIELMLSGVCRFDVAEELSVTTAYRQVVADFGRWQGDMRMPEPPESLRGSLLEALRRFFDRHEIEADWPTVETAPLLGLITSLVMISPFEAREKQALIEAETAEQQAELLITLMNMASLGGDDTMLQ